VFVGMVAQGWIFNRKRRARVSVASAWILALSLMPAQTHADPLPQGSRITGAIRQSQSTQAELAPCTPERPPESHGTIATTFTLVTKDTRIQLCLDTSLIDRDATGQRDEGPYLYLKMLWPSLQAAPTGMYGYDSEKEPLLASGQYLGVSLHLGGNSGLRGVLNYNLKTDWLPLPDDQDFPGFTIYGSKILQQIESDPHVAKKRYLVPRDKRFEGSIYMECPIYPRMPSPRLYCVAHAYLGNLVYLDYTFSRSHLQTWEDIDRRIKQVIQLMLKAPD
jgi:hypothetical protein